MTSLEILKAARELISVPERWTQRAYGRDSDGNDLSYDCLNTAACWCAVGAILRVSSANDYVGKAIAMLCPGAGSTLITFNDTHSHAEVIHAFDRAIAAAEAP